MDLNLETNTRNPLDFQLHLPTGAVLIMTAPLITDRWIFRVQFRKNLALLAVPQFGGVNMHLQSGASCKINIPCEADAKEIVRVIGGSVASVPSAKLAEAIKLLKAAVKNWRCTAPSAGQPEAF